MPKRSPTLSITIATGNAAFEDGNAATECARILRELADRIESRACLPNALPLFDYNGNAIGKAVAK